MKRKRKRKQKRAKPSIFVFTPANLKITQEAMKVFEQSLQQSNSLSEKIAFVQETMQIVNSKLDTMSRSIGAMCLITFDSNEKIAIATAIHLHMLDLIAVSTHPQREKELHQCRQIMRFALDTRKESEQ